MTIGAGGAVMSLPAAPDSAVRARRFVRRTLRGQVADGALDTAEMCMSELVTNAVLHAGTALQAGLTLQADGVRLAVQDASPLTPRMIPHSRTAGTGRGLALVASAATDWGVEPAPGGGKVVWCLLPTQEPEEADEDAILGLWGAQIEEMLQGLDDAPVATQPVATPTASRTAAPRPAAKGHSVTSVVLLGYPVRRGMRMREHREELLRECQLLQLENGHGEDHVTARLVRLAAVLSSEYGAELSEPERRKVEAFMAGQATVDLEYPVPAGARAVLETWQATLAEMDRFCEEGDLLTLATPPDIAALRQWVLGEFFGQTGGDMPRPWPGPPD
jgi:hypothetical protein